MYAVTDSYFFFSNYWRSSTWSIYIANSSQKAISFNSNGLRTLVPFIQIKKRRQKTTTTTKDLGNVELRSRSSIDDVVIGQMFLDSRAKPIAHRPWPLILSNCSCFIWLLCAIKRKPVCPKDSVTSCFERSCSWRLPSVSVIYWPFDQSTNNRRHSQNIFLFNRFQSVTKKTATEIEEESFRFNHNTKHNGKHNFR